MATNDLLIRISGDTKGFAEAMRNVNGQLVQVEKATAKTSLGFNAMGSAMSGVFAGVLSGGAMIAFAQSAVTAAATMDSLNRGLTTVMGSSTKAAIELGKLQEVAKLPGLGFQEAVRGSINLQAAGFNADLARRALLGFGNALATVGKGKAELDGVITALTQISAKGKVSAEEINQLAERLPQIRELMRSSFGTADTEALQKMGISAQFFIEKIIGELEKLPKATGGIQNELENFRDEWNAIMAELGSAVAPMAIDVSKGFLLAVKGIKDALALVYLEMDAARDYFQKWVRSLPPYMQMMIAGAIGMTGRTPLSGGSAPQPQPIKSPVDAGSIERGVKALEGHTKAAKAAAVATKELQGAMQGPLTEAEMMAQTFREVGKAINDLNMREQAANVDLAAKAWKNIVERVKEGTYAVEQYRSVVIDTPAFLPGGLDAALAGADQQRAAARAKQGLEDLSTQYKYVLKDAKESFKGQSAAMREVSTVFTDMSRDIARLVMDGGKLKDVFVGAAKSMAEAMLRLVIQGAFKKLGETIMDSIGKLTGLGKVFSSIFGGSGGGGGVPGMSATSITGISNVPGLGTGPAGGAAGAVGSSVTGIVGAIGGVVSAVSGVIGNFQMAGMNKTLDLIEHEVRYAQIHLLNILEKINKHLPGIDDLNLRLNEAAVNGWKVWSEAGAMQGAFAGGGGVSTTINFSGAWIGYRDVDTFVDDLVRRIKARL